MSVYLTLHQTQAAYDVVKNSLPTPQVALVEENMSVNYQPYVPQHDYSQDYLTFVAQTNCAFSFSNSAPVPLNYSLDGGTTWGTLPTEGKFPSVNVLAGGKILWKDTLIPIGDGGIGSFSSTGNFTVEGNLMSLLYGDNFANQTSLSGKGYAFNHLFFNCTNLTNAENLSLPATTLATSCYNSMFNGCTSLTKAPSVLPATTLAEGCYEYMFYSCDSLTTAPQLPATTLANGCYNNMFSSCTSLTTAPTLPATTLAERCYKDMFNYCTSLNNITCFATNISASNCTDSWVRDVAASGTFTKAASMSSWSSGKNGIPSGWSVKNYPDYSQEYFTMNITTGGDIKWSGSTTANTLSYSIDNGESWTTANSATTISVNASDKVLWKGTPTPLTNKGIGMFSGATNVRYSVEGNAMSLLFGDNFKGQTSFEGKDFVLYGLFNGNTNVVSVENLSLPATTLANLCYYGMFSGCTSLTTAPQLSATTLASYCYGSMFQGCSSLTTAPELPATTLANGCYNNMFGICASLTTAPELPATTLANQCYQYMFYNCTSLTTAPELPATTLADSCYYYMFSRCTSLTSIKCLATNISANNATKNWVSDVAASGTFTKDANMSSWTTGVNGIPSGWSVKNYPDYSQDYFTMVVTSGGDIKWSGSTTANTLSYSKDNGTTWTTANSATTISVNAGDKILWKGTPTPQSEEGIGRFSGDSAVRYSVEGNAMSLLYGDNFKNQTSLSGKDFALCRLFSSNTNITSAENLSLPATTLAVGCYLGMFSSCTSLTTAPSELPATTLADWCYSNMFDNCSSLTTAPVLSATTLAPFCFGQMFFGCTSLTTAPELSATTLASSCYDSMFFNCTSLTTAPSELPATTLERKCYSSMFYGCTSLTSAPELPATTLADACYGNMFYGCTSLNSIKCLATDISADECTEDWVNGVAASGTFTKAASMTSWTTAVRDAS